jgi:hypothetical protein
MGPHISGRLRSSHVSARLIRYRPSRLTISCAPQSRQRNTCAIREVCCHLSVGRVACVGSCDSYATTQPTVTVTDRAAPYPAKPIAGKAVGEIINSVTKRSDVGFDRSRPDPSEPCESGCMRAGRTAQQRRELATGSSTGQSISSSPERHRGHNIAGRASYRRPWSGRVAPTRLP